MRSARRRRDGSPSKGGGGPAGAPPSHDMPSTWRITAVMYCCAACAVSSAAAASTRARTAAAAAALSCVMAAGTTRGTGKTSPRHVPRCTGAPTAVWLTTTRLGGAGCSSSSQGEAAMGGPAAGRFTPITEAPPCAACVLALAGSALTAAWGPATVHPAGSGGVTARVQRELASLRLACTSRMRPFRNRAWASMLYAPTRGATWRGGGERESAGGVALFDPHRPGALHDVRACASSSWRGIRPLR